LKPKHTEFFRGNQNREVFRGNQNTGLFRANQNTQHSSGEIKRPRILQGKSKYTKFFGRNQYTKFFSGN